MDFAEHAQGLTDRRVQEAPNLAATARRPDHFLRSPKTSKEDFIEDIARRDRVSEGLIAVLGAVEPGLAMTVRGRRERRERAPVLETRKCLHLDPYDEHPPGGRCHLRLQSGYPFSVDVCLQHRAGCNGQKADDKFCNLRRIENTLHRPEAFTVYRAEPASTAPTPLRPSPRAPPAAPPHRPFHPQARRTTCVPDLQPQRAGQPWRRSVTDLPRRAEVSRAANRRSLDALARTQVGTPLDPAAAPLCRHLTPNRRRYRALPPLGTDAALLRALSPGEWTIAGFRNRDRQPVLSVGEPRDKKTARRRWAAVGRKLRLLRAHGLIRKLPQTHRYWVTESGRAVLTALVAAQQASTEKLTRALAA